MIVKYYGKNGMKAKIKFKNLRERVIFEEVLKSVSKTVERIK